MHWLTSRHGRLGRVKGLAVLAVMRSLPLTSFMVEHEGGSMTVTGEQREQKGALQREPKAST